MTDKNKTTYLQQSLERMIPNNVRDPEIPIELSAEIRAHIDQWVLRYPPEHKRSGVFEALRVVQEAHKGSLTVPLMDAVADYLGMAKISVYEIAAFYTMFHLNPIGQYLIDICTNLSCRLNGAGKLLEHIQKRLNIELNETTVDGKFTLKEVECLGACISPPVCMIGKKYYVNLTLQKFDELLDALSGKE